MQNCKACFGKKWLKTDKKNKDGIRYWKCYRCGWVQLGDYPYERQIPKILYIDIETSLSKMYNWSLYVKGEYVSPEMLINEWYVICWSASWVGSNKVYTGCVTQTDAKKWTDKGILQPLYDLIDSADIVAGHNVKKFDLKRINTRFKLNNIPMPESYKILDTLVIARSKFQFESNKLDYISQRLGFRPKDAMSLNDWKKIADNGDAKTLRKMAKYNRGDVRNGKAVLESLISWTGSPLDFGARAMRKEPKDLRFVIVG